MPIYHTLLLEHVESTNNYAKQLIAEGRGEGTAVLAQFQTKGRGQAGNFWESEAGKNLLCSIIFYPAFLRAENQFQLSKVISLSMADFLKEEVEGVSVKWPNDIYVGDEKIAGILIENSVKGMVLNSAVVGFGLNVNQLEFLSEAPNPVSLSRITGRRYQLEEVFVKITQHLNQWYTCLETPSGNKKIDEAYWSLLYRREGWHSFSSQGRVFVAKITGIGSFGQLQLLKDDGSSQEYLFKEVEFVK